MMLVIIIAALASGGYGSIIMIVCYSYLSHFHSFTYIIKLIFSLGIPAPLQEQKAQWPNGDTVDRSGQ